MPPKGTPLVVEQTDSHIYAAGFSLRKRAFVRQFLAPRRVRFVQRIEEVPDGATLAVWASGPFGIGTLDTASALRVKTLHIEDGFLRSVGLGADLVRPLSWVIDHRGIYYDATRASDLEHMLQTRVFDDATLARDVER